jgi:long-chain acyl-CoA synthetase
LSDSYPVNPDTLSQLFFGAIDRFATKRAALRYKVDGRWRDLTHQDLTRQVQHTALGLRELGIQAGDRVAILSENRFEWAVSDFACLNSGIVDVAVYPTLNPKQIAYLLNDSGAVAVLASDATQYEKIHQIREDTPALRHVVTFDDLRDDAQALSMAQLIRRGVEAEAKYPGYREEALQQSADTLATLIYTSGTTGDPKGVMLTHGNFTSNVLAALKVLPIGSDDSCLSILPLSHSFERMAGFYTMLHAGVTISYAEGFHTVPENLREVRPTVVLCVPRLYEKFYARVMETALAGGSIKKRIFFWARRVGDRWAQLRLVGKTVPTPLAAQKAVADRLVFSKLRSRTGGRLRYFVSGGAPLAPDISRFFYAAGLPILEGYGLTETSPVISVNPYEALRIGTVGPPLPGIEVSTAEDGEILTRGPHVMKGYYHKPEATREAIDEQGWFHTGDIGTIDPDGYIRITDRKKDIIVTAGGKKIAPQPIENKVKTSPFVSNAVMIGDRHKYAIMLVVPDLQACRQWAADRHLTVDDPHSLIRLPEVAAKVEREVMVNLRDLARFEMPKKILLLADDFTEESGELTPSLKVKRGVIEERYRDEIEAAYAEDSGAEEEESRD